MPGGDDPAYFECIFGVEDRHFWVRARNRARSPLVGWHHERLCQRLPPARSRVRRPKCSADVRARINGLFNAALLQETGLMRCRWRLPFGTSLLAVVRSPG